MLRDRINEIVKRHGYAKIVIGLSKNTFDPLP
jgi:hypothetical protein